MKRTLGSTLGGGRPPAAQMATVEFGNAAKVSNAWGSDRNQSMPTSHRFAGESMEPPRAEQGVNTTHGRVCHRRIKVIEPPT